MPRPPRADEALGIYHALNRGNLRATIFHKEADYAAFEQILGEGLERYRIELLSYELMPNHYHLVLRPLVDREMSRFMKWVGGTHTMRYHAHYKTGGLGHVYQPYGDESWTETIARRLNLESTMRPRGRPRKLPANNHTKHL